MSIASQTWVPNWPSRLQEAVAKQGYSSITAFLSQFPGESYILVAERFDFPVAAAQLSTLHFHEAKTCTNKLREAAMDAFARELNDRLPNGWKPDTETTSDAASAYASTSTFVELEANAPQFNNHVSLMYNALKKRNPHLGWKPTGPTDPLIVAAFDEGWPID